MKIRLAACLLASSLILPGATLAAPCEDMESAAAAAARERNARVREVLDTMLPAPEENRSALASCLDSLNSLGDAFAMGVSLPTLAQILEELCNEVDSRINEKIQQGMTTVENGIQDTFGTNNPFQVSLSASDISRPLTGALK